MSPSNKPTKVELLLNLFYLRFTPYKISLELLEGLYMGFYTGLLILIIKMLAQ